MLPKRGQLSQIKVIAFINFFNLYLLAIQADQAITRKGFPALLTAQEAVKKTVL